MKHFIQLDYDDYLSIVDILETIKMSLDEEECKIIIQTLCDGALKLLQNDEE